ncbi:CUGBP Elav-like family member 2 [Amphibalanus amphitrite]|uniref:CUGBP Elav-like family member 2 n=1 Tax=Amphibalanus amphitrite TaxID=1232801 RepID=UPI001C9295E3|nr:CUGBP Elav-like family member 2 [Amphibalanus amphitrite]
MTTNGSGPLTPPAEDQPDQDTIKMFVGQIPRHMDEPELRAMLEEFGAVYQINVLRDKVSGQSKGCCFVTFFTRKAALEAQNQLHNVRTLAGMHHPIQMKPADTENRNERKLFIGMVSKQCDEADVRAIFARFGPIEECTVLRDQNNHSKGCAFVTFSSRQNAIGAIKAMHQSQTMDGCSAPMVVKFADTQKDKDTRRIQSVASTLWGSGLAGPFSPQYLTLLQQLSGAGGLGLPAMHGFGPVHGAGPLLGHGVQNGGPAVLGAARFSAPTPANGAPATSEPPAAAAATGAAQNGAGAPLLVSTPSSSASMPTLTTLAVQNGCLSQSSASSSLSGASPVSSMPSAPTMEMLTAFSSLQPFGGLTAAAFAQAHMVANNNPAGKRIEGPEGCNLFIYHLPQEMTDADLAHAFMPFGNVISAKVFIDKQTNLSKCFGFVSYDNPTSAQTAIQAMNCFQIGTKRLKVQLKRSKEAPKPY